MEVVDKTERVLGLYTKLINGAIINKGEEATNYKVTERSIQRDIDDIRNFLDQKGVEDGFLNSVVYDRDERGYRLEQIYKIKLTNPEILAICKILLDSRAFTKNEMENMLSKIVDCCVPKINQKEVMKLIANEEYHYIELKHGKVFIDKMWDIGKAINHQKYIEIEYQRLKDKKRVKRRLKPVSIMFSEFYFYMAAFIEDENVKSDFEVSNDIFPTIYRIDRISEISVLDEHFEMPYSNRFEAGEFRKRVQFMYGGRLRKIKFRYTGLSIEAVLDRLPTASIISEENGIYTVTAEVFGDGIDMWIKSQGDLIELG